MENESILVSTGDHAYLEYEVQKIQVVYNTRSNQYYEYAGDEYLEEGEAVVWKWVAV